MADVTIFSDQLGSEWTIWNAAPDPVTGDLDEYNGAIALGAQVGIWYGDRIKALSADVLPDTEKIRELQAAMAAMQGATSANWPAGIEQSMVTAIDAALALGKDTNTFYGTTGYILYRNWTFVDTPPEYASYYTGYRYEGPIIDTGKPFPTNSTTDPADGLIEGRIYRASDGRTYIYLPWDPSDSGYNPEPITTNSYEVTNLTLSIGSVPPDDVITLWQRALQDGAEKLTQITQGKQAFLQELIASMSKYLNFATNVMQRYERNKLDIVGRF